jgi:hypothetical protein
MDSGCDGADAQLLADLSAGIAMDQQAYHLALAWG